MEILIDAALVRSIVGDERGKALSEIGSLGPVEAYRRSRARHDERLMHAADASTLACKPGCAWCCHFSVDVRAVEVFAILDALENLPDVTQHRLIAEIRANSAAAQGATDLERAQRNQKCPFLQDKRCSIYLARPQTCRNYHATDAAGCERSYLEPENLAIDPEFAPLVYQSGGAHVDAFADALAQRGYGTAAYELNAAMAMALADAALARQRFLAGEEPFPGLTKNDVEPEFLDVEDED